MSERPIGFPRFSSANARLAPPWVAKGIQPENIECRDCGTVSIALQSDWIPLLASLQEFSPALTITRNSHAVLGRKGELPEMRLVNEEGTSASDSEGAYDYEFSCWDSARLILPGPDCGGFASLEMCDAHGEIHHKICLYQQIAPVFIEEWAKVFQKRELGQQPAMQPHYGVGSVDQEPPEAITRDGKFLLALMQDAVVSHRKMRIIVGNHATVQGHSFHPQELRRSGQWIFLSDRQHAFHLRIHNLAEVCITADALDCAASIKAYEPEGRLVGVFCIPQNESAHQWNDFIHRNLNRN